MEKLELHCGSTVLIINPASLSVHHLDGILLHFPSKEHDEKRLLPSVSLYAVASRKIPIEVR